MKKKNVSGAALALRTATPAAKAAAALAAKCARARLVVLEIEALSEKRKKLYEEHDELARELRDVPGVEAHGIHIERTFAKKNTIFGHGPVRELSIELVGDQSESKPDAGAKNAA